MEKAVRQYVSGSMFQVFGLRPALGRLLAPADDVRPPAPDAVISYQYWKQRFGRDPAVLGRTLRLGNELFQIIGVAPAGFTGTEPGTSVDVFLPANANPYAARDDSGWLRALVLLHRGSSPQQVLARMIGPFQDEQARRAQTLGLTLPPNRLQDFLHQQLVLAPAPAGVSQAQADYGPALLALGALVALLLLIACANVAHLAAAQASARSREMAMRVALGASRWRLLRLLLAEGACVAALAAALGSILAWWSAPAIVAMLATPGHRLRLFLPLDWQVLAFGLALTFFVTLLFALAPALGASAIRPDRGGRAVCWRAKSARGGREIP